MSKTSLRAILPYRPDIQEKLDWIKKDAGIWHRTEFRLVTNDPNFDPHNQDCEKCHEIHRTPWEDHLIRPDVPERIGKNWAFGHHVESIIEAREVIMEKKPGKKTFPRGTSKNNKSFQPLSEWRAFVKITKSGKVIPI